MEWPFKWKAGESASVCVFAFSCVCGIETALGVLQSPVLPTKRAEWTDETWTEVRSEKKRFTMMRTIPLEYTPWNAKINRSSLNRESNAAHSSFDRKKNYTPNFRKQPRMIMNRARTGFAQRSNRASERCVFMPLSFTYCFVFVFTSFIFDDANWLRGKLNTTTGDASHRYHFDTHHQSESDRAAILFLLVAHVKYTHVQLAYNVDSIWRQMCVRLVARGRWSRQRSAQY